MLIVKTAAQGKQVNGKLVIDTAIDNPTQRGLEALSKRSVVIQRGINHKGFNSVLKLTLPKMAHPSYFFAVIEEVADSLPADDVIFIEPISAVISSPEFVPPKDIMHASEQISRASVDPFEGDMDGDILTPSAPMTSSAEWAGDEDTLDDEYEGSLAFQTLPAIKEPEVVLEHVAIIIEEAPVAVMAEPVLVVAQEKTPVVAEEEEGTIKRSPSFLKSDNVRIVSAAKAEGYLTSTNGWMHDVIMEKVKEVESKAKKSHP